MNRPLVSVVMPTFNSEKYIRSSVHSVLNQTFKNFELIVVDDCSTDHTREQLEIFLNDNRIRYIQLKENLGVAKARNYALRVARGEYVAFIDSDDLWDKRKLQVQVEFMSNYSLDFSYTEYNMIDDNNNVIRIIKSIPDRVSYNTLLRTNYIPILTVMIKRKLILKYMFKPIKHEDYALWLSIFRDGNVKAKLVPMSLASYRVHHDSVSSNKFKSALWVWNIYRYEEKLPFVNTIEYFLMYLLNGILKHYIK